MSLVNGFTAVLSLLAIAVTVNSQVDHNKESARRLQELYQVIHNIALPAPLHGNVVSSKRLVMMLPGKILTERDYHPGPEFIASSSQTDPDKYLDIPPIKMQNLFNLVDVVPGIDPLQGQEGAESLSRHYKNILDRMDIKGLETLAQEQRARQKQSIDFLMEIPERSQDDCNAIEDECVKTRWDLYRYYEEKYNNERKEMEEEIESKRNSTSGLQYQYWFIRTFPILQANVDGAFMDWLVKGDKDIVELYRSRLDTSSAGTLLLEAKSALRASGFTALDRSRTVYPVNFVPGDWYKFLRDPDLKLTADQINLIISYLEARKLILTAMKDSTCDLGSAKETATTTSTDASNSLKANATELMKQRCNCIIKGGSGESCSQYLKGLAGITSAADSAAFASLSLKGLEGLVGNNEAITDEIDKIDAEIESLRQGGGGYSLPELATIPIGPQPSPADSWLQFDYDSSQEITKETREKTSTSFSLSFKARYGLFSIGGSTSYSKQTEDNFSSFKSERVRVGGEILRVSVQMPWFRPELFKESKLTMSDDTVVSPGPSGDDEGFTREANSKDYLIPQYITGLLLCRNLTLEFSNVDKESSYSFVATSLSTSLSVGYGPFSLSASYSRSSQRASFEASATATGLRIRVPGVQLIGYYTEVTPKFPKDE